MTPAADTATKTLSCRISAFSPDSLTKPCEPVTILVHVKAFEALQGPVPLGLALVLFRRTIEPHSSWRYGVHLGRCSPWPLVEEVPLGSDESDHLRDVLGDHLDFGDGIVFYLRGDYGVRESCLYANSTA